MVLGVPFVLTDSFGHDSKCCELVNWRQFSIERGIFHFFSDAKKNLANFSHKEPLLLYARACRNVIFHETKFKGRGIIPLLGC